MRALFHHLHRTFCNAAKLNGAFRDIVSPLHGECSGLVEQFMKRMEVMAFHIPVRLFGLLVQGKCLPGYSTASIEPPEQRRRSKFSPGRCPQWSQGIQSDPTALDIDLDTLPGQIARLNRRRDGAVPGGMAERLKAPVC